MTVYAGEAEARFQDTSSVLMRGVTITYDPDPDGGEGTIAGNDADLLSREIRSRPGGMMSNAFDLEFNSLKLPGCRMEPPPGSVLRFSHIGPRPL